jgi:hypothetical protein
MVQLDMSLNLVSADTIAIPICFDVQFFDFSTDLADPISHSNLLQSLEDRFLIALITRNRNLHDYK